MNEQPNSIAVIGAEGFVGRSLHRALAAAGRAGLGTTRRNATPELAWFDLEAPDVGSLNLAERRCAAAVIAAAVTGSRFCHDHPEAARKVNVDGAVETVRQLDALGIRGVYLSTDYVFDGSTGGYDESARPAPCLEYGRQKAEAEQRIAAISSLCLIVRLCRVCGLEKGDGSLLDELAANLSAGRTVRAASDQVFNTLFLPDLSSAIMRLVDRGATGIFHLCSPEFFSRHQLALRMATALGADQRLVREISIHDLDPDIRRPQNTSLICTRRGELDPFSFIDIPTGIQRIAAQWQADS